uniref:Uncharacterized protein n=1 Tax=Syphacia muris TaxID=451379 RepID=A0A0N5B1G2_9BILA
MTEKLVGYAIEKEKEGRWRSRRWRRRRRRRRNGGGMEEERSSGSRDWPFKLLPNKLLQCPVRY